MPELRKYIRYNAQGNAILKAEDGSSRSIKTDLVDISFIGIGVYAQEKIEAGIDVKLELITKLLGEPIIGEGKIKYVKEIKRYDTDIFRMGIEFTNIDKKTIQHIINRIQADIRAEARKKERSKRYPSTSRHF